MNIDDVKKALRQLPGAAEGLAKLTLLNCKYPGFEQIPTAKLRELPEPLGTLCVVRQQLIGAFNTLDSFITRYLELPPLTNTRHAVADWMQHCNLSTPTFVRIAEALDSESVMLSLLDIANDLDNVDKSRVLSIVESRGLTLVWQVITNNDWLEIKEDGNRTI